MMEATLFWGLVSFLAIIFVGSFWFNPRLWQNPRRWGAVYIPRVIITAVIGMLILIIDTALTQSFGIVFDLSIMTGPAILISWIAWAAISQLTQKIQNADMMEFFDIYRGESRRELPIVLVFAAICWVSLKDTQMYRCSPLLSRTAFTTDK